MLVGFEIANFNLSASRKQMKIRSVMFRDLYCLTLHESGPKLQCLSRISAFYCLHCLINILAKRIESMPKCPQLLYPLLHLLRCPLKLRNNKQNPSQKYQKNNCMSKYGYNSIRWSQH